MAQQKKSLGVYAFSACSGCEIAVLNLENLLTELLSNFNIKFFHLVQGKNKEEKVDVLFIEGAVTTEKHKEKLLELRKKAKTVIALGSCACTGGIPAMKNDVSRDELSKITYGKNPPTKSTKPQAIDKFIDVDYYIRGCPINKEEFAQTVLSLLGGKRPFGQPYPVCTECRKNENDCLLEKKEICFGPITYMGCNAECPGKGVPCTGCRGLSEEAELASYINLLKENKISTKRIKESFDNFLSDRLDKKTQNMLK